MRLLLWLYEPSLRCVEVAGLRIWSRSLAADGAGEEEANEAEDRHGAESYVALGGAGTGGASRFGLALSGSSEPDSCLEQAACGPSVTGTLDRQWRCGGAPANASWSAGTPKIGQLIVDRELFGQDVRKMSTPVREFVERHMPAAPTATICNLIGSGERNGRLD